jgi:hypothetical protein
MKAFGEMVVQLHTFVILILDVQDVQFHVPAGLLPGKEHPLMCDVGGAENLLSPPEIEPQFPRGLLRVGYWPN